MTGMMPHARQALDDRRHARQGPQIGTEPLRPRPRPQGALDLRQLLRVELGLPARAPCGFESPRALRAPRLMPVIHRRGRHAQRARHGALRLAPGEQPGGLQPPCFQRGKIATRLGGHVSPWHRTYEIH